MPTRLADLLRRFRRVVAPGAAGPPGEPVGASRHDEALDALLHRITELDAAAEARVVAARRQAEQIRQAAREEAVELRAGAGPAAVAEQARVEAGEQNAHEEEIAAAATRSARGVDEVAARSRDLIDPTADRAVALLRAFGDTVAAAVPEGHP